MTEPSFLSLPDNRKLAYVLSEGQGPTVLFCGGFKSDMQGGKALALEAFCRARGQRFIRFDYTGHGQSSGRFIDGCIGDWFSDALAIVDALVPGKLLLVGSSMGGWIAALVAKARKEKLVGFVGIASAPDFTEALIWQQFTPDQQQQMVKEGVVHLPSCYGEEAYPITHKLVEEGRRHLILAGPIDISVPVRLLHGTRDEDVPWKISAAFLQQVTSADAQLTLIKDGDHRLSNPGQLALLCAKVGELL